MDVNLEQLLGRVDDDVKSELAHMPEVVEKGDSLDVANLPIVARKWHRLDDAVAVVADLKSSTRLGLNKRAASTASIYEAATGNVSRIFADFAADFVAIQGDGAFGLYWGEDRYERALCAGITIKTFSKRFLVPRLEAKWQTLPETGLKLGIASGTLLAKKVGIPRQPDHQEPVWAGRAVNFAAKCAQQADRNEMIVCGSIWDKFRENEFVAATCGCGSGGPYTSLWEDVVVEKIPEDDGERQGKLLHSQWCTTHGAEFCQAILNGNTKRADVADQVVMSSAREMGIVERLTAARNRAEQARKRGLRRR